MASTKFHPLVYIGFIFLLSCSSKEVPDNSRYFLYEDSSLTLTPEKALQLFEQGKFIEESKHSFNAGFTTSNYWLVVEHHAEKSRMYLEIGTSQINEIIFYEIDGGQPRSTIVTGDYLAYSSRPVPTLNFTLPLDDHHSRYMLMVSKRNESMQLTFLTRDAEEYLQEEGERSLLMGVMSGAIGLMLIFGLFLFAITREKVYLFYILYILVAWLYIIANQGYGYKYIWPDSPWFASRARPVFTLLTLAFSLHFIEYYTGKIASRWISLPLRVLMGISYLLFFLFLIPGIESKATRFGYVMQAVLPILAGIYLFVLTAALIQKLMTGNRMALFYLISLLPIVMFSALQISYYSGGLDFSGSYLQHFGQATGMVMEAVILTFGLAYRFNTYRKEKEALLINLNRQQAAYARAIISTQQSERRQLADQLHDVAGSLLSAARLNLSSVREKNFIANEEARKKLASAEGAVSDISNMLRNLSHAISPVMLEKVGFRQSVEKIIGIFNASQKITFELDMIGFEAEDDKMLEKYAVLYGMLYELMNNVAKHAKASHALIQLIEHEDSVTLIIEDNGIAVDLAAIDAGTTHGLSAIKSKVHYLNGQFSIDCAEPSGLIVTIEIPKAQ